MMFAHEPPLIQQVNDTGFRKKIKAPLGDVRQPWIDLSQTCGISEFAAKAFFVFGVMRRYILSANAILCKMNHYGFLSAYGALSSAIELLGRCIHADDEVRQHPEQHSLARLKEGLEYIRDPQSRHPPEIVIGTNHDSYKVGDLVNLRNLVIHGACIAAPNRIKADIELLHELRKALYGIPAGETSPPGCKGPIGGAVDRYYEELLAGTVDKCDRLAGAAISPLHFLRLQDGDWPFAEQIINEMRQVIAENTSNNRPPVSGSHIKREDFFQLYPLR